MRYNKENTTISKEIIMSKNSLGVMIDLSRNAVMKADALERFIKILKKMGYNTVFLYMEDTYEVIDEKYFGYMRGRYSIDEMKQIDEICASYGIEAIPCIQTLAHLKTFLKWKQADVDCDDILLVGAKRTYDLIGNMFKTLSKCFRSRKIHIGMDEAHMLGKGRYFSQNGYKSSSDIIKEHLDKICEIAKPYNYELLLWSDMFFRSWNKGEYYFNEYVQAPKSVASTLPENVTPVYWDYYNERRESYDVMIKMHKQLSKNVWFAGGAWCWTGFAPLNKLSIRLMKEAMLACRDNRVKNIFFTMWGDDGMECSHFSQLPALMCLAEYAKGNFDDNKIKQKFKRIVGIDFDDFMKVDLPNCLPKEPNYAESPSKYMLYSDPFLGFLDYTVSDGVSKTYESHKNELLAVAKKTKKFGYVFNTLAELCSVLELKYELGVKTRASYQGGNKCELEQLANNEYRVLQKRVKAFHRSFSLQWNKDNKSYGFEVQDARLGGLIMRLEACRKQILDYVRGKIEKIEELECEILPLPFSKAPKGEPIDYGAYGRIVTANVLTQDM